MSVCLAGIQNFLQQYSHCNIRRYWIAYSGGLDSTVLLHLMKNLQLAQPIYAIHINHNLQAKAQDWAAHCQAVCDALGVPLISESVNAQPVKGDSPEAAARVVRYEAIAAHIQPGDCVLTAQHQDDQAETLLLQLLRGSGVDGLAAMSLISPFAQGYILRPLLHNTREELLVYAHQQQLRWVEDPSNQHDHCSRNFLRNQVMPLLKTRWPALSRTLARSAGIQAEVLELLKEQAESDLKQLHGQVLGTLPAGKMLAMSAARRRNVLRHWLGKQITQNPSFAQLIEIEKLLVAKPHASACIKLGRHEIRCYRQNLYCLPVTPHHPQPYVFNMDDLPDVLQQSLQHCTRIEIRYRQGGERIRLPGRKHHHSVKKLLQEKAVPPWLRDHLPFLYADGQLLAILGIDPPLLGQFVPQDIDAKGP